MLNLLGPLRTVLNNFRTHGHREHVGKTQALSSKSQEKDSHINHCKSTNGRNLAKLGCWSICPKTCDVGTSHSTDLSRFQGPASSPVQGHLPLPKNMAALELKCQALHSASRQKHHQVQHGSKKKPETGHRNNRKIWGHNVISYKFKSQLDDVDVQTA